MTTQTQQRSIFLVDDDEDDREMFTAALSLVNEQVLLTQLIDGQQMMDALNELESLPGFIFLDLNMPKCSGMECLQKMAELNVFDTTTVAVLSTSSNPESIEKAFELGATYYIVKPTNFSNLKSCIAKVLEIGNQRNVKRTKKDFLLA